MDSSIPSFLAYGDPPFELHSGGESHWFVNGTIIWDDPHLRELVLDCWEKELRRIFPGHKLFHFIGVPRGGIPWANAVTGRFENATCWGEDARIATPEGATIIAVDDVLTTGASIKEVKDAQWALVVVARVPASMHFPSVMAWAKIDLPLLEE